jgi:hypothetical protein
VWGRIGGEQYGIPRICNVLEQHGLKANFMIDTPPASVTEAPDCNGSWTS